MGSRIAASHVAATNSYFVRYWSKDAKRTMLGGVKESSTSRYQSKQDAEDRLTGIIDIHANLDTPLEVAGEVCGSSESPEIFKDGSTIGCKWGIANEHAQGRF